MTKHFDVVTFRKSNWPVTTDKPPDGGDGVKALLDGLVDDITRLRCAVDDLRDLVAIRTKLR